MQSGLCNGGVGVTAIAAIPGPELGPGIGPVLDQGYRVGNQNTVCPPFGKGERWRLVFLGRPPMRCTDAPVDGHIQPFGVVLVAGRGPLFDNGVARRTKFGT